MDYTQSGPRHEQAGTSRTFGESCNEFDESSRILCPAKGTPTPLDLFLQSRSPGMFTNEPVTSTSTRPPTFFDMHLHEDLRLKSIVVLDDLVGELPKLCDPYIEQVSDARKNDFHALKPLESRRDQKITDETSLQNHLQVIANMYSKVASGLLFKTDWVSVFRFHSKPKGYAHLKEAIADSYLHTTNEKQVLDQLSEQDLSDIELIEKHHFQNFMVAEVKSLHCGDDILSPELMQASHRVCGRLRVTGRQIGPDSTDTDGLIQRSRISTNYPCSNPNLTDKTERKRKRTRHVIQQLWTATVVQDATFVVFSSGKIEYIGIRHREQQTLYISALIRPTEHKDYVKLQVGLCIASYVDALDRAKRLETMLESGSQSLPTRFHLLIDEQLHISEPPKQLDPHKIDESNNRIKADFKRIQEITLFVNSFTLAVTQESNIWTLRRIGSCQDQRNRSTQIDSLLPYPSTGKFLAKLSVPLILKMSMTHDEALNLQLEHKRYGEIGPIKGLVEDLGLFSCQINSREKRYFLLLEDGGDSLYLRMNNQTKCGRGTKKDPRKHLKYHRAKYMKALKFLHKKGYTHNSINMRALVMKGKRAFIIDLKKCIKPTLSRLPSAIQKDINDMKFCLGIKKRVNVLRRPRLGHTWHKIQAIRAQTG
ncbi:hypothetical protein CPB84DRAFT_1843847 [Gymnopilus junonius]|uniref:Uncharacterized protein n=1 Tax=Gymnopilus junonius TaxID=109634 RepID=A0A9P5TQK1_GYMJU|nr:hypothetical protein CPB84DRAFT_1843847 [Gymnopilus junonius]